MAALPDAVRRGDAATYQEVTCRSALNRVEGMPFKWTLNPYRGCTHGCHYCFARRYQTQLELGAGDEFSSIIFVKTNLLEVLRRELARASWMREQVALGTATDPYQPIEGQYRLTRGALQAFCDARTPVGVVTKGPMAVRDRDVLAELGRRTSCTVCFSVPSVDEGAWHSLEPGTAHPMQRLRAVRQLVDAGVRAGVLMAPLVPGITTNRAGLERTVKAAADHGAAFIGANLLHLQGGTRDHFLSFLAGQYPHLLPKYSRLYPGKYARKEYASQVYGMLKAIQQRYRLNDRQFAKDSDAEKTGGDATASAAPEQVVFSWR